MREILRLINSTGSRIVTQLFMKTLSVLVGGCVLTVLLTFLPIIILMGVGIGISWEILALIKRMITKYGRRDTITISGSMKRNS